MSDKLERLHANISDKLNEIGGLFTEPPKITIVIRTPWLDDGGVVLTNDDFDAAIAEIQRLRTKGTVTGEHPTPHGKEERR